QAAVQAEQFYPLFIFVSSISTYADYLGDTNVMETIIDNAARLNMFVILGDSLMDATNSYASLTKKVKTIQSGILYNKYSGQNVFNIMNNSREPELFQNDAYVMSNGKAIRIRIPNQREGESNE
ncbi:hypothetical protein HB943_16550, partial [Listeria weihenstephanensis]